LKRVFPGYTRLAIDEFTAKRMINLFAAGQSLPEEFIKGLPVLIAGASDSSSA